LYEIRGLKCNGQCPQKSILDRDTYGKGGHFSASVKRGIPADGRPVAAKVPRIGSQRGLEGGSTPKI
jgi:hypothetical protein